MKKIYLDVTELKECTSVWIKDVEIIRAGTTVYSMPIRHKNEEYERFAKEYDIHFIFDDNIPVIDFYTIPQVDILATDSRGGYIGTIGQMSDLESEAPICYIDRDRKCYLISKTGKDFLQKVSSWKDVLAPYEEIKFYSSKTEAMKENEFYENSMSRLNAQHFSKKYIVKKMEKKDAQLIYDMTRRNLQYYEYCGRQNTLEDIYSDLELTPPGISQKDKYYIGYFMDEELIAVMDLIDGFPDKETAYIGFFMMNADYQGNGIGTQIISELFEYLRKVGFVRVRLGIDKDNPQSTHFWEKQGFIAVKEVPQDGGVIVVADKRF